MNRADIQNITQLTQFLCKKYKLELYEITPSINIKTGFYFIDLYTDAGIYFQVFYNHAKGFGFVPASDDEDDIGFGYFPNPDVFHNGAIEEIDAAFHAFYHPFLTLRSKSHKSSNQPELATHI